MTLRALKNEISELQAGEHPLPCNETLSGENEAKDPIPVSRHAESVSETRLLSPDGIAYIDPRPLRYCQEYQFLIKPTVIDCRGCGSAWNVKEMSSEEWIWYLDPETGAVTEHGDENSIPVTVFLKVANITRKDQLRIVVVRDKFKDATACPRRIPCKP